ncbi:extracellular solute-binding protein [Marinomonas rhizomae]|uniref:Iron(III) transport system substrate-binding protein n=1 Tax=Marinomonas rhizomae TaxID=491948 RepID=A0A366JCX1_9GAMM|nr:extracellular solute-binding protein [Marinomonas rhizomae]RBP84657.1 iron(III) transport system substrate-binding protein [Marinomonas rhizomae]RNF75138.1 extracellular solute-binding protein [Marinomonas rhizomae]
MKQIKRTSRFCAPAITTLGTALLTAFPSISFASGEVNIYSARKEALIAPALDAYSKKYRVNVNLITGDADMLLNKLKAEGDASPADIFITVDAGRLYRAKEAGVLRAFETDTLDEAVPAHLKDPEGYWYGLSQRARIIFYNPKKVTKEELSTYEDLADSKWKGRLCTRSSSNIYNQSLVASMIAANGQEKTLEWIKGFVSNLSRPPFGGDTDLLNAVSVGVCDITLANSYYYGRLGQSSDAKEREIYNKVALFWPNQGENERGAHVNVSGIAMTASASNVRNARRLVDFLTNEESQTWYAQANTEYPVVEGIAPPKSLQPFGEFKADTLSLNVLGENNRLAVELMNKGGWK